MATIEFGTGVEFYSYSRGRFTFTWHSVSKNVVLLLHAFARFRLISCVIERVAVAVMSSTLNKRTAQRRCSSWEKTKATDELLE